ncbi:MAG: ABC transporter ATP-binding protein [Candidatus Omnitrophica bacterium]|nr:ABC transporter ATP-binding protein [Candidatus Omnitrophota bacterium]
MNILRVENLKTYFPAPDGVFKAVDDVSFAINKGEVFGLVGESGSGKTLTALSILRLVPPPGRIAGGKVFFGLNDLMKLGEEHFRPLRGSKISMVFQEPSTALNPVFTIGEQLLEAVIAHQQSLGRHKTRDLVMHYLDRVHIQDPARVFGSYPHQLSGGTKQRVMIAMALLNMPELLILDEPTTALDVTIQAQILDLLDEIIAKEMLSILFISHDFGVIGRMCERLAVMYKGRIVEAGSAKEIFSDPKNSYTISLLESVRALA